MSKRIAFALAAAGAAALSFFVVAPAAMGQAPLNCDGTVNGGTYTAVTVHSGDVCRLANVHVLGSVIVNKNAELDTCASTIVGSVNTTKDYVNIDNETTIGGSLTLQNPGATISAGGSPCSEKGIYDYAAYVCPSYVGGSINVLKAPNWWQEVAIGDCGDMQIGGSVNIEHNREFVYIEDATVAGALICVDNHPPAAAYYTTVGGAQIGCEPEYTS